MCSGCGCNNKGEIVYWRGKDLKVLYWGDKEGVVEFVGVVFICS